MTALTEENSKENKVQTEITIDQNMSKKWGQQRS